MSERHVLFMVTDFAPLASIGRVRTQKMCKFLPEVGWRTSVLTIEPPPGALTDPSLLAEVPAGTSVYRVPCPQPIEAPVRLASWVAHRLAGRRRHAAAGNSTAVSSGSHASSRLDRASRWVDWAKRGLTRRLMIPDDAVTALPGMVRAAVNIVRRERVDVIVASVPGFSPWLAAVVAGRRTGVPVVVDYRDLWHRDVLRAWVGPVRRQLELALERWALARTEAVVTASAGKMQSVQQLVRQAGPKSYATIYNGFDMDDLAGIAPRRLEGDAGRMVLLHAGKLYGNRRIDPLLESVGRLIRAGRMPASHVRVRTLGTIDTDQQQRIDEIIRQYGLQGVVQTCGYVAPREALAQQLGADAVVVIVDPGETAAGVVPGKLTECLGLGRFVVAVCPPGEARTMLERYGHAVWASADGPDALDAALSATFGQWQRPGGLGDGQAPRDVVPTRRQNAEQLAAVLTDVVERREAPAALAAPLPPAVYGYPG